MSANPQLALSPEPTREEIVLRLLGLAGTLLLLGPLTLAAIVWLFVRARPPIGRVGHLLAAAPPGLALCALLWPALGPAYADLFTGGRPVAAAGIIWGATLPLAPSGALLALGWERLMKLIRPRTVSQQLADERAWQSRFDARLSDAAAERALALPRAQRGKLRLGSWIGGDFFPPELGVEHRGGVVSLDEGLLDTHALIVGATGEGKTELLKRLCAEVLANTDRQLLLIDGKGETALAEAIRGLIWRERRYSAPVFRLGHATPGARYDGFRGAPEDIYNRLAAMVGVEQAEGNALIYANINRTLLQLVCKAPGGPPRSFGEVLDRLDPRWLHDAYRDDHRALGFLRRLKPDAFTGLLFHLLPSVRDFEELIGPEGFALEGVEAALFSLRTQSVGDTAKSFLRFFLEDLKDYLGKRQTRPALIIIDEFGVLAQRSVIALLMLARSARLGIVLATQDVGSLGDEKTRRAILANTRTKLLMATDFPQEIVDLAGTVFDIEHSIQHEEGKPTGRGSGRAQHRFRVLPNEVRSLRRAEAVIIRKNTAAKLRVSKVEGIPPAPPERATTRRSTVSPPSPERVVETDWRDEGGEREPAPPKAPVGTAETPRPPRGGKGQSALPGRARKPPRIVDP